MASHGDRIRVNVGGEIFVTTKATLGTFSESMLGAIASGRWSPSRQQLQQEEEEFFLDRDPRLFRIILEYLRNGGDEEILMEALERGDVACYRLNRELEFYGLPCVGASEAADIKRFSRKHFFGDGLVEIVKQDGTTDLLPKHAIKYVQGTSSRGSTVHFGEYCCEAYVVVQESTTECLAVLQSGTGQLHSLNENLHFLKLRKW